MAQGSRKARRATTRAFGKACAYCGGLGPMTWDHWIPKSAGGLPVRGNLVPACEPCNLAKGALLPADALPADVVARVQALLQPLVAEQVQRAAARKAWRKAAQEVTPCDA